ncbi:cytochrome P450 [Streptomyces sp. NPDC006879]|uniref:cytochrome P450 n=1 Tax=Streptomyces sp. NPDC006879 TaxID=3364767 RepID=UPI0036D01F88
MTSEPETMAATDTGGPHAHPCTGMAGMSGPEHTEGEPVHFWDLEDLPAQDFDPFLDARLKETRIARIRMPFGTDSGWLVTRYEDVKTATSDPRFSRQALVDRPEVTSSSPHPIAAKHAALNYTDPPRLTQMRSVIARAFTGKSMQRLRPMAQRTANALLDEMELKGPPADLMEHLHGPFPLTVVADLLGLPEEERGALTDWANVIMAPGQLPERSKAGLATVRELIASLLVRRRTDPTDDLAGVLAAAVVAGEISEPESVSLATAVLVSGAHAVRNNSANMVYALLTHPEQLSRLRAEPELLPQAVDELLRYIPHRSGVGIPRIALEDVAIGGVVIREGEAVFASYIAANRDPEMFPHPDTIDFDRGPIAHVSFGNGPHHCVGSMLARMESEIIVATLLDRFPKLRLAVPAEELTWQKGALIRGPETLPVVW